MGRLNINYKKWIGILVILFICRSLIYMTCKGTVRSIILDILTVSVLLIIGHAVIKRSKKYFCIICIPVYIFTIVNKFIYYTYIPSYGIHLSSCLYHILCLYFCIMISYICIKKYNSIIVKIVVVLIAILLAGASYANLFASNQIGDCQYAIKETGVDVRGKVENVKSMHDGNYYIIKINTEGSTLSLICSKDQYKNAFSSDIEVGESVHIKYLPGSRRVMEILD